MAATTVSSTWHPGMKKCSVCDYPATHTVGNGEFSTKTAVCDAHIRCGAGMTDGDHHTYMVHPNAYLGMLDAGGYR
jgi:hypothetical protein